MMMTQKFFTVPEVSILLRKSKSHIYDLILRGELKAMKFSARRTRVVASSLSEYIERQIDNQGVGEYNKNVQPPKKGA